MCGSRSGGTRGRMGRLRLKDVTVCAADCVHPQLAARALEICLDKVDFGDAVLFADVPVPGRFRNEAIAPLRSAGDYSRFCIQDLPKRVASKFALVVQWDGYVVEPKCGPASSCDTTTSAHLAFRPSKPARKSGGS